MDKKNMTLGWEQWVHSHSELPTAEYKADRGRWSFTPYIAKVTNVFSYTMWCLVATFSLSLPVMNTKNYVV